jgi:hypothetical protein
VDRSGTRSCRSKNRYARVPVCGLIAHYNGGRTRRAEFCRGDHVGDPPAKPTDQGLHQHGVRATTLSSLSLGDNPVGPLRTHSLSGARCRRLGSGPAGIHRHARGTQLRKNASAGFLNREGGPARKYRSWAWRNCCSQSLTYQLERASRLIQLSATPHLADATTSRNGRKQPQQPPR